MKKKIRECLSCCLTPQLTSFNKQAVIFYVCFAPRFISSNYEKLVPFLAVWKTTLVYMSAPPKLKNSRL